MRLLDGPEMRDVAGEVFFWCEVEVNLVKLTLVSIGPRGNEGQEGG